MNLWKMCLGIPAMVAALLFAGNVASAAEEELDDTDITLAVESALIFNEAVPSHNIDVSTANGIVTLAGSVDSYYAKLEAEEAAESVKGVLLVVNEIEVKPLVRTDSQIRSDVINALAIDPVAESFEIDVEVENRIVTLSGDVDSYSERMVAEQVAEGVKGVADVRNLLTYDLVEDRTDTDIQQDIEYRLRSDASIGAGLIDVAVTNGEVTLDGSVGSAAEKSEAETEAWIVPGVKSVTNKLDVEWWLAGEQSDWGDGWSDEDAEQAVESALLTNPRVNSFDVITTVEDGVATLTGTVDNLEAKQAAEEEAEDTLGVRRVSNYLRVRPALERTDTEIAADIRNALRNAPTVDRYDIAVAVYNGKAYLSGEVDSWYMKNRAESTAAGVPGVIEIQNNLDVDYEYVAKTDQEIKEDINSQLWWSPFVDSDDIEVEVHSGVATLKGTVEDWDELEAAKENARQAGATSVLNQLEIENGYTTQ